VEENGGLMLYRMNLFFLEDRARVGNQEVVDSLPAEMPESGFPFRAAPRRNRCAGGSAMEIQAEGVVAAPNLADRSQSRAELR
jgi:hypothetical protein